MGEFHPTVGKWSMTFHTVRAERLTESMESLTAVEDLVGHIGRISNDNKEVRFGVREDPMKVPVGHWVVKDPDGKVTTLDDETFQSLYTPANE